MLITQNPLLPPQQILKKRNSPCLLYIPLFPSGAFDRKSQLHRSPQRHRMLAADRVHAVIDNHQLDLVATDKSIGKKSLSSNQTSRCTQSVET